MPPDDVAPTAVPLSRLRACQRVFGGSTRVFNFNAAGCRWRVHHRHLGEGGIAFDDPAQDQRYRNLSDEELREFTAKLRRLVDGADLERIRNRTRLQRLHAGMRLATRSPVRQAKPRQPHEPRPRTREPRRRNVRAGSRKARAPGSQGDDEPDDLIRLAAASGRLWAHVRRREARQRLAA
jgi:hypothetical protein